MAQTSVISYSLHFSHNSNFTLIAIELHKSNSVGNYLHTVKDFTVVTTDVH